ncbi:uncharacterized protein LOC117116307 [Anneissia japonica]|uniref:uncharacterized protein LOC117116307 n=1 Tax=Anneissia japonica TaxID=1529436 RepID=UPI0014254EAD|nr:uncharacterized protein LOC117116307 [Anneissia japonica]
MKNEDVEEEHSGSKMDTVKQLVVICISLGCVYGAPATGNLDVESFQHKGLLVHRYSAEDNCYISSLADFNDTRSEQENLSGVFKYRLEPTSEINRQYFSYTATASLKRVCSGAENILWSEIHVDDEQMTRQKRGCTVQCSYCESEQEGSDDDVSEVADAPPSILSSSDVEQEWMEPRREEHGEESIFAVSDAEEFDLEEEVAQKEGSSSKHNEAKMTDDVFTNIKMEVSRWYDDQNAINMLKLLYRDHVPNLFKLHNFCNTMDLLNELITYGALSSSDPTIIYDTIKATCQFGLETKIKCKIPSCPNIREVEVSKFTPYRQKLMKLGISLSPEDVRKISAIYNTPVKKYADNWSLIIDLETRMILCEDKMDTFKDKLRENGIFAANCLTEDGELKPTASKRRKLMLEGDRDTVIKNYLLKRQKNLCCRVNRFTPATLRTLYQVDIANMFTDLELLKENKEEGKLVTLQELLDVIKSTPACRTLIEGEGGIGKSTLLRYLAYNWANESDKTFEEMVQLALKLGFVYLDEPHSKTDFEQCFTAPHKLIAESLVGFYISKLCQTAGLENNCAEDLKLLLTPLDEDEWEIIKESEYLQMARTFTMQFLGANVGKFFIHWLTKDLSTYRSLMKNYLTSVKAEHQVFVEEALIDHMTKTHLKIQPHVNGICKSLMRFIHHINPSLEVFEDEHFIKLTRIIYDMKLRPSVTPPHFKSLCNKMSPEEKGKMLAHILFAIRDETYMLENIIPEVCADDDIKYLTAEYKKLDMHYDIRHYKVFNKSSITALFLIHLLTNSPKLEELNLNFCITGDIMNDMIRELSGREINLVLQSLYINDNNLSTFNGASLASLMSISPQLIQLKLSNCSLTGDIMNDMIRELSGSGIKLGLESLDINDNNLSAINGASLASLMLFTPQLIKLKSSNCSLTGDIMNDMIRELSGRGIKLGLQYLNIDGNNLSKINGASLASLITPILDMLHLSNCNLTGDIMNDMIRELSGSGIKLGLESLHIDGNNLSKINGASLASLITPILDMLHLSNCNLTGDIMNDMIRELSGRGIKLGLQFLSIDGNNLSTINGASLASLMSVTPQLNDLKLVNCSLTGDIMNDMIRELSGREIKLALHFLFIDGNNLSTINGASLSSLITLIRHMLHLSNCNLTGDIMNDMIRELSGRGIKLGLHYLKIYGNNLSTINGASLASLMSVTPQLNGLTLSNCSLTGDIMNDMIRELSGREIKLALQTLSIDGNNLSTINGASLASLITPILHMLVLSNCNLTGDIMNDMIRELSSRGIKLGLQFLSIDGNNLCMINGALLASLITPKLHRLHLSNCNLTGDIMNDMIRELSSRGIKLDLWYLSIDGNNLFMINGASLSSLITPILHTLRLSNCNLTGDSMNDMIRELSSRGIKLELQFLYINGNNLCMINGASLSSLITPILHALHLSNCNLTGNIMNDMIRELSSRGIKLGLQFLSIDGNNLSTINGALLASLITPKLHRLHLSNCSLTGDIMDDMIRELSSRGIKLDLWYLYINGNNLCMINGASLSSLITPILHTFHLSNCNLTGDIMNDMIRELSGRGIKLGLQYLKIDGNNLSTINGASLASLITPKLIHFTLSNCSLTDYIVNDMMRELSSEGIKVYVFQW